MVTDDRHLLSSKVCNFIQKNKHCHVGQDQSTRINNMLLIVDDTY